MIEINKEQYKMLQRINKNEILYCKDISDEELSICIFLYKNNLLEKKTKTESIPVSDTNLNTIKIVPYFFQ